jgi:hypothetical protein
MTNKEYKNFPLGRKVSIKSIDNTGSVLISIMTTDPGKLSMHMAVGTIGKVIAHENKHRIAIVRFPTLNVDARFAINTDGTNCYLIPVINYNQFWTLDTLNA